MTAHLHGCRDCGAGIDVGCLSDEECFWSGGDDGCPQPHRRPHEASTCPGTNVEPRRT